MGAQFKNWLNSGRGFFPLNTSVVTVKLKKRPNTCANDFRTMSLQLVLFEPDKIYVHALREKGLH